MRVRRLLPTLLLVPLGVVAGHQAAYAAVHTHPSGLAEGHAHGHLGPLTALAVPLGLVGAAWLAQHVNRHLVVPALTVLAGVQMLAFVVMEAAERLAAGGDLAALAGSPLLWIGLAIQMVTALVVGPILGAAGRAATVLLQRATTVMTSGPRTVSTPWPTRQRPPRPLAVTRWLLQRGPPGLLGP